MCEKIGNGLKWELQYFNDYLVG